MVKTKIRVSQNPEHKAQPNLLVALADENEAQTFSVRQEAPNLVSNDHTDGEALRRDNNNTTIDLGVRTTTRTSQVNDEKKLGQVLHHSLLGM